MSEIDPKLHATTARVAQYIAQQKASLFEAREHHRNTLNSLMADRHRLQHEISQLQQQEQALTQGIQHEVADVQQSETRVGELSEREAQLQQETRTLRDQVTEILQQVQTKRHESSTLQQRFTANRDKDLPESLIYEEILGLRILGVKDDLLRFVFTNITNDNPAKQHSFLLDVSAEEYQVTETAPPVDARQLALLVSQLNKSRDLTLFLSRIRHAFKQQQQ
jgi:uncharacterized protein YoxC